MPRLIPTLVLLLLATGSAAQRSVPNGVLASEAESREAGRLLDRVVALIGDDPIYLSDIERAIALTLVEPLEGEERQALERRVLAGLIDQRLRLQAVERYDLPPPPAAEIERQLEEIAARVGGRQALERQLLELGLGEDDLRRLVERQLRVLIFVEQRLRPRVFVEPEAIRAYYDDVLIPALSGQGEEPPPPDEVEAEIRAVLRELELDQEIERWTAELKSSAEVVYLYDRPERPLPPVLQLLTFEP